MSIYYIVTLEAKSRKHKMRKYLPKLKNGNYLISEIEILLNLRLKCIRNKMKNYTLKLKITFKL